MLAGLFDRHLSGGWAGSNTDSRTLKGNRVHTAGNKHLRTQVCSRTNLHLEVALSGGGLNNSKPITTQLKVDWRPVR
jgi:hypothetical protein